MQCSAFDHYQRYCLASELLALLWSQGGIDPAGLTVLDLGGIQGFLRSFLPREVAIVTANIERSSYDTPSRDNDHYVLLGRGNLPFRDDAFAFSVCCDVLEHVSGGERLRFLEELSRVTRYGVVLACPFNTPGVQDAESLVSGIHESLFGIPYRFLVEHEREGLPELEPTKEVFAGLFDSCAVYPSSYLPYWVCFMAANIGLARNPETRQLNQRLASLYATLYYPRDRREPAYRYFLVGAKSGLRVDWPAISETILSKETAEPSDLPGHAAAATAIVALGVLREQAALLGRRDDAAQKLAAATAEQQRLVKELDSARAASAELATERSALHDAQQRLMKELNLARAASAELAAARSALHDAQQRVQSLSAELKAAHDALDAALWSERQLHAARDGAVHEAASLRDKLEQLSLQRARAEETLALEKTRAEEAFALEKTRADEALAAMSSELELLRSALDASVQQGQQLKDERHAIANRIAELELKLARSRR